MVITTAYLGAWLVAVPGATGAAFALEPLSSAWVESPTQYAIRTDLRLEDLYPKKSFIGKTARNAAWSFDDRYLAFLWNPYDDRGFDLWLYDSMQGTSKRLTSIELMANFDRDLPEVIERYKKEKQEEERRKGLSEEERKKLEEEDDKKEEERRKQEERGEREPQREYAGISGFVWAHNSHELLFEYRGDIFRLRIGQELPKRLTKTRDSESDPKYTKDDSGFFFRRADGVYRMRFDSADIVQLNPPLPKNMSMSGYNISPDETKMMISSSRNTGSSRQVDYITYRDRFAEARKATRDVADDPFRTESYLFIYDLNDDPKDNPKHDGKPWQIYFWPAGKEYGQTSINEEPWSPDSKQFVFAMWKRDQRILEVVVADIEKKELKTILKDTHAGGHTTPGMTRPFFTADGKRVVCLLEKSGFRHVWVIDPLVEGATQLTRGDFEVYPQKLSKDGKSLYVTSWKEHSSRMDVYSVDMISGEMTRLTTQVGAYSSPEFSHGFDKFAATFRSWNSLTELYVVQGGKETKVTDSHPDTFWKVHKILPRLFEYTNRHGHVIRGYIYLPPDWKKTDKRPLMIYVYGGPLGTTKDVVQGSFNSFNMYLAYKYGYITVTIDPRGMSGYGGAFENANWEAPGQAQTEDLVDGVKFLVENYGVDPTKVGIHGWSFGGFQTQMCMYSAPDVFTLGIAGAGPTEWQNYNNWYSGGVIGQSDGKPENLDKYSLTHLAKNLKSPLLLVHGVEDTNVLFQDTIKVYQALLKAGRGPLVELVVDPTGGHGLGGDIRTLERYKIYEAFILKHWGSYKN